MFCPKCGAPVNPGARFCNRCGASLSTPESSQSYPDAPARSEDSGSFGWAVLGFFIPIVGLILYLVWRSEKPRSARQAGRGALVSVILNVILVILVAALS